jgi:hypothetical protein
MIQLTSAIASFGVTLKRAGNVIAELTKIGNPALKLDTQEVTTHQSADSYREYIGTLLDGGEVSIEGNFIASDSNGQMGLVADMNAKTLQAFVITFPTAITATWTFSALVTAFDLGDMAIDGTVSFSASLKISGKPVLAVTASTGLTTPFFTVSNAAVITPAPAGNVYEYVATVLTGVSSVTVTPTATAGTIKVNGNVVASGVASSAIALGAAGSVTEITIEVAEAGKTTKTYAIHLTRPAI